jgi:hypothetical protein
VKRKSKAQGESLPPIKKEFNSFKRSLSDMESKTREKKISQSVKKGRHVNGSKSINNLISDFKLMNRPLSEKIRPSVDTTLDE